MGGGSPSAPPSAPKNKSPTSPGESPAPQNAAPPNLERHSERTRNGACTSPISCASRSATGQRVGQSARSSVPAVPSAPSVPSFQDFFLRGLLHRDDHRKSERSERSERKGVMIVRPTYSRVVPGSAPGRAPITRLGTSRWASSPQRLPAVGFQRTTRFCIKGRPVVGSLLTLQGLSDAVATAFPHGATLRWSAVCRRVPQNRRRLRRQDLQHRRGMVR